MNQLDIIVPDIKKIKTISNDIIEFEQFRKTQYEQIEYFANLCVDYISKQKKNYLTRVETSTRNDIKYEDIFGYRRQRVQVKVKDKSTKTGKKTFLSFLVPELIDDSFFYINGSYYSPTCYILDKPISVKKKSLKLFGLFNSVTIFTKDKRAIFTGSNMPVSYFIPFMVDDIQLIKDYEEKFNLSSIRNQHSNKDIIKYFAGIFQCEEKKKDILEKFNNLFLDDYTKKLYRVCYGDLPQNFDIRDIIKLGLNMCLEDERPSFVDLREKRMIFIELILHPIFKKCADVAARASQGFETTAIESDSESVIKHFTKKLKNKFLYDIANLYSGLPNNKVSFLNPGSDNAPGSISSTHPTHFQRICPITVSAQRPGETISIVPHLKLNKMGLFVDEQHNVI